MGGGMEGSRDITIDDKFVVHVLDHRQPSVQCSQSLTPLPEDLQEVIKSYLLSLLKPGSRRRHYGRFMQDSPVLAEYQRLLDSVKRLGYVEQELFLETSQRLARLLFTAMQQTGQKGATSRPGAITPGDLLVGLFYSQAPAASPTPYLFLIKVHLESAWQRRIEAHGKGEMRTVLRRQESMIPRLTGAHVQKSALIRWADDPLSYDIVMADPQGGQSDVARFFSEIFLQSAPFHTADEQAEMLFRRANNWVTTNEDTLSPQERGDVMETVRTLLDTHTTRAESITPRQLIEALPLREPRTADTVKELHQSFEVALTVPTEAEDHIPVDLELAIRNVPPPVAKTRMTYQLDDGVQLSGDQEAIARLFSVPPHQVDDFTEFTVRTSTFRPILSPRFRP